MKTIVRLIHAVAVTAVLATSGPSVGDELRGTGDLAVVIERAAGSLQIIDTSAKVAVARVEGLGDLSHASVVFSRDARYAFVFGRDGGLTKVDLLTAAVVEAVSVPVVASGGAGCATHLYEAFAVANADAALAAGIFPDQEVRIGEVKQSLAERGIAVRTTEEAA